MYAGELIEQNQVAPLFATPRHPYTQGLLRSVLNPQSRASQLFFVPGSVPTAGQALTGCRFHPRCPIKQPGRCDAEVPALLPDNTDAGLTRCHLSGEPVSADAWQTNALPGPAPLNAS
jgi:peptide/nickel transport system ATP-binding protein